MARNRKRRRGISLGTIIMILLCLGTLAFAGVVFLRITDSGQEDIAFAPKMLTEPFSIMARNVIDAETTRSTEGGDDPAGDSEPGEAAPTLTIAEATPEPIPSEPPVREFSITAIGQVVAGNELRVSARQDSGTLDYNAILAPVSAALSSADLSIATLRTQLTDNDTAYDAYNAPSALASTLKAGGVSLVNLATDRVVDHGTQGVDTTRSVLEAMGLPSGGAYRTAEERQNLSVLNINGVKVGLLAYTNSISTAGSKAATEAEIAQATRLFSAPQAAQDIASLRAKGADIIIVLAHWGSRNDSKVTAEMKSMADSLATAGADVIIGTNPTRALELERRTVSGDGGQTREVFIAYSLGNFLTDESRDTGEITGLILHLGIQWDTQLKRATFTDSWYMPTWIMRYKDSGGTNRYRVVPAGTATIPEGMTDSIYANMQKSYQSTATKLGTDFAQPKADP